MIKKDVEINFVTSSKTTTTHPPACGRLGSNLHILGIIVYNYYQVNCWTIVPIFV